MSRSPVLIIALLLASAINARAASNEDWENTDSKVKPPPSYDEGQQKRPRAGEDGFDESEGAKRPGLESDNLTRGDARFIDDRQPYWGMEVRLTPFKPVLSSNAQVKRLYDMIYEHNGTGVIKGHPLMFGVDADWYPLQTFGLRSPVPGFLGVYGRVSYWTVTGPTRVCYVPNTDPQKIAHCNATTVFESSLGNDTGSINVIPVGIGVVYRLDSIRRNTGFPLLFNFKGGFDYYIWWASSGGGPAHYVNPNTGQQSVAQGGTLGFSVSAGLSLGLDAFGGGKPGAGGDRGMTRSAIFAEYMLQDGHAIAGKNMSERLDFTSDNQSMITIGLELEFL